MSSVSIQQPKTLALIQRFTDIRKHSVTICEHLQPEDYVVQPTLDISPPKWHLAHTTWFWEEFVLSVYQKGYKRFHPRYAFLFNSYYESVGERVLRLDRGNMSRPTVNEVLDYRNYVNEHMTRLLENIPAEAISLIELGLNHEQQHQELLYTDIKYILGHNPLFPVYNKQFSENNSKPGTGTWIQINAGKYPIGHTGKSFCFDNELSTHAVYVHDFEINSQLVTNGEFLDFMKNGGYTNPMLWHSDGWTWVNENLIDAPLYWHYMNGEWKRYALSGLENINPDDPVTHISFYEAAAFAEWKGMRLPTEFEWEIASDKFAWGQRWEHTNSAYLPYPGFSKPAGAVGEYNGKFMINQMVLRGASIVTPKDHSRKTYRNFFHPHLRWQFNGIRLCKKQTLSVEQHN